MPDHFVKQTRFANRRRLARTKELMIPTGVRHWSDYWLIDSTDDPDAGIRSMDYMIEAAQKRIRRRFNDQQPNWIQQIRSDRECIAPCVKPE
jgi:hypothetical protein